MARTTSIALLALILHVVSADDGTAQERRLTADELYEDATRLAERGDTTTATVLLRRAVERDRDHPDAVFALGTLLTRTAGSKETEFAQRREAEALLERAFQLRDGDPAVLLEMGLLKRKQNIRVDARRLLEQALDPDRDAALDPRAAAYAHYELGRILEEELADYEHLVFLPPSRREFGEASADPLGGTSSGAFCPAGVAFFCYNYTRTRDFNLLFEEVASPASDRAETYPPRIEEQYRTALAYDPGLEPAARSLMALYLRLGRTEEFREVARELVDTYPGRPYPWVFEGLALYERGQWEDARRSFERGLALMPPDERVAFEDVSALLQRTQLNAYSALGDDERLEYADVLWAKSDPLYLVPGNERWMEHVARVTYAELNFGAPELGMRGWQSDRGLVYIRYGAPRKIWSINTSTRLTSGTSDRWILWNYRVDAPSFIFYSQAGYRSVRFDQAANTQAYASELAESESTTAFRSRAVTTWIDLPHQIARLRGSESDLTQVVAYVDANPSRFLLFEGDSVTTALFLFTPQHRDTAELRSSISADASGNIVFATQLYPADYDYAIEAFARESKVAGTERGVLPVRGFRPDGLSLSDLVVADGVTPRVEDPIRWTDFSIGASRDLTFGAEEEIHLYFELYGLSMDGNGEARYELEITVEDVTAEGLVSSVVRSLGDLVGLGDDADTRLRFDRVAEPRDGIVPEYLSLLLTDVEPGDYLVHVKVRDEMSDDEREIVRQIVIEP
jgi:GWxTD domain-containing protein